MSVAATDLVLYCSANMPPKSRRRTGYGTVYALCDPVSGVIRYVGKTLVQPRDRLRRHVRDAGHGLDTRVCRWIRTLDREPTMLTLEVCPEAEVGRAEQVWIYALRASGLRLCNVTDGGDGGQLGHSPSAETRAKIGAAHRGKKVSAETRARQSAAKADPSKPHSIYREKVSREEQSARQSVGLKRAWVERREHMLVIAERARASKARKREATCP